MKSLTPAEYARWRTEGRPHRLLDVREPEEWALCRLEPAELRPASTVAQWLPELVAAPGEVPLVVVCHHGIRSARICGLLCQEGVREVWNLRGGLEGWALDVDPGLPRY